jgi:hypothetical protein
MFLGLINEVKSAAGSLVGKYLVRASVAVPFVVAIGFGIAALTLMLINRFGAISAYWMLAAGFTLVGLVAALAVAVKEQDDEIAESRAVAEDASSVATSAATQAAMQAPMALLSALLATPVGPTALAGGARMLARNIPLIVLLALIGLLSWPSQPVVAEASDSGEADLGNRKPSPAHAPSANGLHREAA